MACFSIPRPVEPMTLAEARRMTRDVDFASRFDPVTRQLAWRMCNAARRGQIPPGTRCAVLVLVAGTASPTEPPKDAA